MKPDPVLRKRGWRGNLAALARTTGLWRVLIWAGKIMASIIRVRNQGGLFFFFPYYHLGGAELVHAALSECFASECPWIIITRRSNNRALAQRFERVGRLFDLWRLGAVYPFALGLAGGVINRHLNAIVLGANSPFFYDLVPLLAHHVRVVDLTHAFDGLEEKSIQNADRFAARIVISTSLREQMSHQYGQAGLDRKLSDRIRVVENRISVPASPPTKPQTGPLRVLYVGRGTSEKRVHLVGHVAAQCAARGLPITFKAVGEGVPDALREEDRNFCEVVDLVPQDLLLDCYGKVQVLLLTSSREGMPLVVMEAMAQGVVPVCTDVGAIAEHIRHGENGFLVPPEDEARVVASIITILESLCREPDRLYSISRAAYEYAKAHFARAGLFAEYRSAVLGPAH